MEIPEILKKLLSDNNLSALLPFIKLLGENSFDIKKAIGSITPETLMNLGGEFLKNNVPESSFKAEKNGVSPIANIADKDIVYILNRYVSAEN